MRKDRKAQVDPLKVIVLAIILLVVAVIILVIFRTIFGKQAKSLEEQVGGLGDCDDDGRANFLDPCPKDPEDGEECYTKLIKGTCEPDLTSKRSPPEKEAE